MDLDKDLGEHLEKFNRQILIKKDKKMQRDILAFWEGKAFSWNASQSQSPLIKIELFISMYCFLNKEKIIFFWLFIMI